MKRLRQRNDLTTFPRTHSQEVRESPFELQQAGPQVRGLVMQVLLSGNPAVICKQTSIRIDTAFQDFLKLNFFLTCLRLALKKPNLFCCKVIPFKEDLGSVFTWAAVGGRP